MKNKKNNLEVFLSSRTGKRVFNIFYSWGAAVVIIGAMFKIMHLQYADIMLMTGMITEALVFFISGFDNSDANDSNYVSENTGAINGGIINTASDNITTDNNIQQSGKKAAANPVGGSGGSVVIVGGGGGFSGNAGGTGTIPASAGNGNAATIIPNNNTNTGSGSTTASGTVGGGTANAGQSAAGVSPEYIQNMGQTAQNLDEFSKTMQSLNEASLAMVDTCKQISGSQNLADNLSALNQNVEALNTVFGSISEQMNSIRYINDSLERMRSLYDGAIGDGYMFKEESAKMTRHIQALNNVYARLLQAMSNNNNLNNPNNNPPVY